MAADEKRGATLRGLTALMVLAGIIAAGASRSAVPEIVMRAKQVVFGEPGGGNAGTGTGAVTGGAVSGSPGISAGSPGGSGFAHGRGHTHASGNGGGNSQGVGPDGVPPSHAGGNGKDHADGNGKDHADGNGKAHAGGNGKGNGPPPLSPRRPAAGSARPAR